MTKKKDNNKITTENKTKLIFIRLERDFILNSNEIRIINEKKMTSATSCLDNCQWNEFKDYLQKLRDFPQTIIDNEFKDHSFPKAPGCIENEMKIIIKQFNEDQEMMRNQL